MGAQAPDVGQPMKRANADALEPRTTQTPLSTHVQLTSPCGRIRHLYA